MMNTISAKYYCGLATVLGGLLAILSACEDKLPTYEESSDLAIIESIRILNAGEHHDEILTGKVDEDTKIISFPKLSPESNFEAMEIQATMPPGAHLEKSVFSVNFAEGEAQKDIVLRVINNKRFKEYYLRLRLDIPPTGADFEKTRIYDYTANSEGQPTYPSFTGLSTRGYAFTQKYAVIPSRAKGIPPHILEVEKLRQYKVEPIEAKGIPGGFFNVNNAAAENGHVYFFNLALGKSSGFNIWYCDANTDPQAQFVNLGPIKFGELDGGQGRYGDGSGLVLDEKGNGYLYVAANPGVAVGRVRITNYNQLSDPKNLPTPVNLSNTGNVSGFVDKDKVFVTSHEAPLIVADVDLREIMRIPTEVVPARAEDARIVHFNGERYLLTLTCARTGEDATVLYLYDITKGKTDLEALKDFVERETHKPIFEYSLAGPTNLAPSVRTGFSVEKDAKGRDVRLTISGGTTDAGFVIIDFPVKQNEKEEW